MCEMKICTKCGEEKEVTTEFFNKRKLNKDGFRGECRTCQSEDSKHYHKANLEKVKARTKAYREANPEKGKARARAWREANLKRFNTKAKAWKDANPERYKASIKAWSEANPEKLKASTKRWREANLEKAKANVKAWSEANLNKVRQLGQRRRARKSNLPSTLTLEQWETTMQHFNNRCAYCGEIKPLTQDHFVPLSKFGSYTQDNIIPSCLSCNSSKGPKPFSIWYHQHPFYAKVREKKILKYLGYNKQKQQLSIF